jgi:site-specific DNA recombinase
MEQLRAITAVRLSHLTDTTTSVSTQTESIEDYCQRKNIQVIASTEDLDVSGGKPIRERPGIGPYLTDEHIGEWDVLVLYKLDRGFRSHHDFVNFYYEFCEMRGKQIISVGEQLDMSTPMGKFTAGILVQFAEWELLRMRERRSAAQTAIRREARYGGGSFTFGYEPYKEGSYYYLRPHPLYKAITVQMAEDIISGKAAGTVARELNDRNIPTSSDVQRIYAGKPAKGIKWTTHSVVQHLRSDAIRGYVLHYQPGKRPVRVLDADGEYVMRDALIDDETWRKVQRQLDQNTVVHSGVRSSGSAMLRIAFCAYCGAPLHQSRYTNPNGTKREYYRCRDMRSDSCQWSWLMRQSELETFVADTLLDAVGSCEVTGTKIIPGDDHSETLKSLGAQIQDLTAQQFTPGAVVPDDIEQRVSVLKAEYMRVSMLPKEDDRTEPVKTGKTFAQQWEQWTSDQRHSYLRSAKVKVYVSRNETGSADVMPDVMAIDPEGLTVFGSNDKWRITVYLGDLAALREQASQV